MKIEEQKQATVVMFQHIDEDHFLDLAYMTEDESESLEGALEELLDKSKISDYRVCSAGDPQTFRSLVASAELALRLDPGSLLRKGGKA